MMKRSLPVILAGIACLMLIAAGCTSPAPTTPAAPAATTAAQAVTPAEPASTATPAPAVHPWTGTWNTSWLEKDGNLTASRITFTQTGSEVSGNYSYTYPESGTFVGSLNATVTGNTLAGKYAESDNDTGYLVFELAGDQKSFTGRWVHAANQSELANSTLTWNGVRE